MKTKSGGNIRLFGGKQLLTHFDEENVGKRKYQSSKGECTCCGEEKRIAQRGLCFFCVMGDCPCNRPQYVNEPDEEYVIREIMGGDNNPELWHWKRIFDARRNRNRFSINSE